MAGEQMALRRRLTSASAWSDVAHNFRGDWQMLWKEITIGFLLAGFISLVGNDFFNTLFLTDAPGPVAAVENVIVGLLIAVSASSAPSGTFHSPPCCGRAASASAAWWRSSSPI
jgi:hypothetical protein